MVVGLTPPGRGVRYHVESPVDARDRLVAFVLAYLADDDGECTVSRGELAAYTCMDEPTVSRALRSLVEDGQVELAAEPQRSKPNRYRLLRSTLGARQFDAEARRQGTVFILLEFGVSIKYLNALCRAGVGLMADLAARVEAFRASPTAVELGFDVFLKYEDDVRRIGPQSGAALLKAYDEWAAESSSDSKASP